MKDDVSTAAATDHLRDGKEPSFLNALIVEDDETQRALIERAATRAGYAVSFARSASEAIRLVRGRKFDCVTLDRGLDDGDGTDVMLAMAKVRFKGAVILVSGMGVEQRTAVRKVAKRCGIRVHGMPKPLDLSALRVYLADLAKHLYGLPQHHDWGGIQVVHEHEKHRGAR